ncbi:UDP-N-acetylmuramate--L-alanine ligase [Candidatus Aerophobetes bacterium]|uniref:UDP-N-acetylmuramate--L-alanine ligase n=1 Tax=Aerophobetes bacterium TaxID=2030807 RepID=A0A662DE16_UNCAE|nr:MAG: UDP-N-acetylmuramate--L-alanine ligase [Candidatus Aerophobetes bacterium]
MHLHFVGVGGIGMSGLAKILLQSGYKVSGSDVKETEITQKLREQGAKIYKGHRKSHIEDADIVVFSSAISPDNPEIREAKKRDVPLISRGELVAQITNSKENIVIAGTHGKTTTTALVAELLINTGKDPTILIGGVLKKINSNSKLGKSRWAVIESDESDASFLFLHPYIAVLTNVEDDHLDFYGSPRNILQAFIKFADKIKSEGAGVVNLDDPALFYLLKKKKLRKRVLTFGLNSQADIWAEDIKLEKLGCRFKIGYGKNIMGEVKVPLPGLHNVYNCLATVGVGYLLGVDWIKIKKSLSSFKGVKRRLEKVGQIGKVPVFDDYAHHPTEIKATLAELKRLGRRLIVIFQPHRYTRTKLLLPCFLSAFDKADILILTPIYAASETPISGITGETLFKLLYKRRRLPTYYFSSKQKIINFVKNNLQENDIIVTIGAGDITSLSTQLILEFGK